MHLLFYCDLSHQAYQYQNLDIINTQYTQYQWDILNNSQRKMHLPIFPTHLVFHVNINNKHSQESLMLQKACLDYLWW